MKKPKLLASLALAAALVLALAACTSAASSSAPPASAAAPSSSSAPAPASVPASVASSSASMPTGEVEKLDEILTEEQVQLYQDAYNTYLQLQNLSLPDGRFFSAETGEAGLEEADYNGIPYYKATGTVQSWDEFYTIVTGLFTPEYFDELNGTNEQHPLWVQIDGQLYSLLGARGANIEYVGPDRYRLLSSSEDSIEFMVVGQYEKMDTSEPYTEEFPIILTRTENGWRFSLFGITI